MTVITEHECEDSLRPCPRCQALICPECEDWRRHHSFRGRFGRTWRRYVSRWFVR